MIEDIKKYRVKILNKFDYILDPNGIEITEEDLEQIGIRKCFDVARNCVVEYDDTKDKRIKTIGEAISERKKFLSNSDYHLFKYIEGEISASEFEPIKSQRALWRKEINQLEEELKRYETI